MLAATDDVVGRINILRSGSYPNICQVPMRDITALDVATRVAPSTWDAVLFALLNCMDPILQITISHQIEYNMPLTVIFRPAAQYPRLEVAQFYCRLEWQFYWGIGEQIAS